MLLSPGTRLGPYEISAWLGAGGMGEVYRARDSRLARDVAVKILSPGVARDPERLRRFELEARAAGALNHPNVVGIYDTGTTEDGPYLVSELLLGETLRKRLEGGALPVRKAVDYAVQVAEGLAAAHEAGIVHRDLKPENVFVLRDGRVKILDFGLAKLARPESPGADATMTSTPETGQGVVLGTVGYMAPEQVRGEPADHRADIFAFGAILYEMVAGRRAFHCTTSAETMTAILKEDPPELSADRNIPAALDRLVRHCLEKRPEHRFQSARDLAFGLESLSGISESSKEIVSPRVRHRWRTWAGRAALLMLGAGFTAGLLLWRGGAGQQETPVLHYLTYSGHDSSPAASPDGRTIAFTSDRDGRPRIWLKQLTGGGEVALTAGPDDLARFSPDGSMLLFVRNDGVRNSLYRSGVLGGDPRKLVDDVAEADWSPNGRQIAFLRWVSEKGSTTSVIGLVDVDGGSAREIARLANRQLVRVRWSPDGRSLAVVQTMRAGIGAGILVWDLASGSAHFLPGLATNINAVAWSGGDLVYSQADSAAAGVIASSAAGIRYNLKTGARQTIFWSPSSSSTLDVVEDGRLVFDARSTREVLREFRLQDRTLSAASRFLTRGNGSDRQPAYSPDGEWVIFSSNRSGNLDLWEVSTSTGAVRRLTDDPGDDWDPTFSPDGKTIAWSSNRSGHFEIWMADADGSGARRVSNDGDDAENPAFTSDGGILYSSANPAKLGLWKIRPDGTQAVRLMAGDTLQPALSPDGRYATCRLRFGPRRLAVHVLRLSDGAPAAPDIDINVARPLLGSLGRSRWTPDGRAIVFTSQDERGVVGLFIQDFVPGQDTSRTRRPLGAFDPDFATESFGISADGSRITVASWEQVFSLMLADKVPGIVRARAR